jgi:sugar O-acyltransferase (sialic acid O-acetyltransferase NeuD family)
MTASRDIYIVCAGGHAGVLVDALVRGGRTPRGLFDNDASLHGQDVLGVSVVGDDDDLAKMDPNKIVLVNALGNRPGGNATGLNRRKDLFEKLKAQGFDFESVVSPDATLSDHIDIGEGCQIITRALVHPGCRVGANTIINTGASLDHDCIVGAHCHIAPWAVLCGGVTVGEGSHIGARAVLVPGITVGLGAVVGAGAVVIDDVPPNTTVVGNPAKPLPHPAPGEEA